MFKTKLSVSDGTNPVPTSQQYRLMGAIAALILISLITSSGGSPIEHTIYNCWEGFIWGIADPVIGLDRLAGIVAVGLLSARFIRGAWIGLAFVFAALFGQIIHLSSLNLPSIAPGIEIAIAFFSIIFGIIFILPTQISWLACTILGVIAGLFHGYADSQAIIGAQISTMATYLIGVSLTQTAIVLSARKIGIMFTKQASKQIFHKTIRWVGLTFCAIGVVFFANAVI
ncbi:HupE/UreJ family protein [Sphaerospermopsis torques-reginae]|uniref:HupE/UreJ family protein n=1 Tax=Sphaerospermopsis torques-reginae ITEP-024 TaxID=984208 RepID=A0ABX8X5J5_9CYAN|nr:HupE/UreJ family protein [Sphaerospermopsis torques-reginae]QYX33977.1 HupE/UreJ family protein [Sphaerospermopsis torques-reginae ITEP-024]